MCLKSAVYVKIALTCHPIAIFQVLKSAKQADLEENGW